MSHNLPGGERPTQYTARPGPIGTHFGHRRRVGLSRPPSALYSCRRSADCVISVPNALIAMLNLFPSSDVTRRIPRRQWLRMSAATGTGLSLPRLLQAEATARRSPDSPPATARSCIYIFLCGGPSQPDLWDLKPHAPAGIRTVFEPIETSVPGIRFGSLIPQVAQHVDKLALIRSMTHADNDHNGAIARTLLGQFPARRGEAFIARDDHPAIGAILHRLLGGQGAAPAWVVLPRPFTTYSPPHKGQTAGFLGPSFDPLAFQKEAKGSLSDAPLALDAVALPERVDETRLRARLGLVEAVHSEAALTAASPAAELLRECGQSRGHERGARRLRSGAGARSNSRPLRAQRIRPEFSDGPAADRSGRAHCQRVLDLLRRKGMPVQPVGQPWRGERRVRDRRTNDRRAAIDSPVLHPLVRPQLFGPAR